MKIAIIGSGISGLGAALLLSQKHEVHVYEASARLGGHAHTSAIQKDGKFLNVDTGFLVYNDLTYPHLKAMFEYLGVETVASDMSLSIQIPGAHLEWAGDNLNTVFAQRKNLLNPKFYKLLFQILDFHKKAEQNRDLARDQRWTIGQMIEQQKYSQELRDWYILPMVAAIWSTPEVGMMDFPAETFLTFFINHKLLQVNDRPIWRTVKNGSKNYVDKIAERLKHIYLSEPVHAVEQAGNRIKVLSSTQSQEFDKVIFATHAPVTAQIFKFKNSAQAQFLDSFSTIGNKAYLHEDPTFMPKSKRCWASWNVRAQKDTHYKDKVSLTYLLNRLQPLATARNLFLTLNPAFSPVETIFKADYEHPKFDQPAIDAQKLLPSLQGQNGVYFVGAWTRYGFHEDGLLSAVRAAALLDVTPPWGIK